eukprot:TRINITY_DN3447_c0_g2_i2.p1 TRINITY_DN3447_c0_g2~~TRINITY_DN3447_c0_g2_i2.p1  ORF type:complete len:1871 (+),score=446.76 TRINITY_DN3447_c0_g2_i2:158-5770(+)
MQDDLARLSDRQVLALLPRVLLRALPQGGQPRAAHSQHSASVLFVDISGFSTVASRLQKFTDEGAEALSFHLNCYFERLINVVRCHAGDVIFFSGDAMLVAWLDSDDGPTRAVDCGMQMLAECQSHSFDIDADGSPLTCSMSLHIGGATGQLCALICGGAGGSLLGQWKYVLTGMPVELAGVAANLGHNGQLVVTADMLGSAKKRPESAKVIAPVRGQLVEFGLIADVEPHAPTPAPANTPPSLRTRMTAEPLRRVGALFSFDTLLHATIRGTTGELRTVSTVFVQFTGVDCVMTPPAGLHKLINHAVRCVQKALQVGDGVLNKVMMDDKGLICLCLFGIPHHTHEDDAARALSFAHRVQKRLNQDCGAVSIGISRAHVFCGLTGSTYRNEYTVLGDGVNISARLMCKAADFSEGKRRHIMCDEETALSRGSDRVGLAFVDADNIMLKGQDQPTRCFHVVAERDKEKFEATLRDANSDDSSCSSGSSMGSRSSRQSRSSIVSLDSSSSRGLRRGSKRRGIGKNVATLIKSPTHAADDSGIRKPRGPDGDLSALRSGGGSSGSLCSRRSSQGSATSRSSRSSVSSFRGKARQLALGRGVVALLGSPAGQGRGQPGAVGTVSRSRRLPPAAGTDPFGAQGDDQPESPGVLRKSLGGADSILQDLYDDPLEAEASPQLADIAKDESRDDLLTRGLSSPGRQPSPRRRPQCGGRVSVGGGASSGGSPASSMPPESPRSGSAAGEGARSIIGRSRELAALHDLVNPARRKARSKGACLVLTGGPGSGKSALLRRAGEIGVQCSMASVVLRGSESQAGEQFACLRDTVGLLEADQIQDLLGGDPDTLPAAPLLNHVCRIPGLPRPGAGLADLPVAEQMERTREVLLKVLQAQHAPQQLLILVDDVQWVDPCTGAWIAHALRSGCHAVVTQRLMAAHALQSSGWAAQIDAGMEKSRRRSVRSVALSRASDDSQDFLAFATDDVVDDGNLDELLAELSVEPPMHLAPLTESGSAALLRNAWRCDVIDPAVVREVHERCAGVPGHTVDLAAVMLDSAIIAVRLGRAGIALGAQLDETAASSMPSIEVGVMRQVDSLTAEQRKALSLAAVLGARFCVGAFEDCLRLQGSERGDDSLAHGSTLFSPGGDSDCAQLLDNLVDRGLLRVEKRTAASAKRKSSIWRRRRSSGKVQPQGIEVGGVLLSRRDALAFVVPLERDVIYNSVLARDRRRLHEYAARALLNGAPLPSEAVLSLELGLHFRRTGDLGTGWVYVSAAYEDAVARGDAALGLQNVAELVVFAEKLDMAAARPNPSSTGSSLHYARGEGDTCLSRPNRWYRREWMLGAAMCLFEIGQSAVAIEHAQRSAAMQPGEDFEERRIDTAPQPQNKRRRKPCCCFGGGAQSDPDETYSAPQGGHAAAVMQQAQALVLVAECMLREGNGAALRDQAARMREFSRDHLGGRCLIPDAGLRAALRVPDPDAPRHRGVPDTAFDVLAIGAQLDAVATLEAAPGSAPEGAAPGCLRTLEALREPRASNSRGEDYAAVAPPKRPSVLSWCIACRAAARICAGDGLGALLDAACLSRRAEPRGVVLGAVLSHVVCLTFNPRACRGQWLQASSTDIDLVRGATNPSIGSGLFDGTGSVSPRGSPSGGQALRPPPSLPLIRHEASDMSLSESCAEAMLLVAAEALEAARRSGGPTRETVLGVKMAQAATLLTPVHGLALVVLAEAAAPQQDRLADAVALLQQAAAAMPLLRPAGSFFAGLLAQGSSDPSAWSLFGQSVHWALRCGMHSSPHALRAAAHLLGGDAADSQVQSACRFALLSDRGPQADVPDDAQPLRGAATEAALRTVNRCNFDFPEIAKLQELRVRLCGDTGVSRCETG